MAKQHDQLRYLSQATLLEEARTPQLIRGALLVTSLAFFGFLLWASATTVREVARAPGQVVPQGHVQVIQHLEGGIVEKILVQEGDLVDVGQVLVEFNGISAGADVNELQNRKQALQLQAIRLRAFAEGETPDFSGFSENAVREQEKIFASMIGNRSSEQKIIKDQLARKKEALNLLKARENTLKVNADIAKRARDAKKELYDQGLTSRFSYLETEQAVNQLIGEYQEVQSSQNQARQEIAEFENRLKSLGARYKNDAYQQLDQVETELASITETLTKFQSKVARLQVRAPTRGIIKGLSLNTIGSVVQSGETLMEIVPLDEKLIVEMRVAPSDIGHVAIDQPVRVKVSAFDFSRYGVIEGKITNLSATTFITPENISYYRARVALDKNYVGQPSQGLMVLPGMTIEADIVTGKKTILAYLLKPIQTSFAQALGER